MSVWKKECAAVMRMHNVSTLRGATCVNVTLDSLEMGSRVEHSNNKSLWSVVLGTPHGGLNAWVSQQLLLDF